MRKEPYINLQEAKKEDLPDFARDLQSAFVAALVKNFGPWNGGPIPSDVDLWESFDSPNSVVYHILLDDIKVGGAVLKIDEKSRHNFLDLFFVSSSRHDCGIGLAAWKAIEKKYPNTAVWETFTPYSDKRNIHFYVNKCGFRVVEFFNKHHPDVRIPKSQYGKSIPGCEEFLRLQKVME